MAGHIRSPRPRDVPGFAEAAAAGVTPPRPSRSPSLLPGTTAHSALVGCGVVLVGAAAIVAVAIAVGPTKGNQATVPALLMMLGATAVGIGAMIAAIRRFRRALLAELAAGYVTTTFYQGLFWMVNGLGPRAGDDVVGWVWDGVWVLNSAGGVVSAPDPDVDPPGFYPSPNRTGQFELWTGSQWTGVHGAGRMTGSRCAGGKNNTL